MKHIKAGSPFLRKTLLTLLLLAPWPGISQEASRAYKTAGHPGRTVDAAGDPVRVYTNDDEQPVHPLAATWKLPATPLTVMNTFVVTTTADTGVGSLRSAIVSANSSPGLDRITFSTSGTINLHSPLPEITDPIIIDGATPPVIELNGSQAGTRANGLVITAGNSTIRGLAINRFVGIADTGGFGIVLDVNGGNVIEGNYIGTNLAGTATLPNSGNGIAISGGSTRNRIGGTTPQARNVISGNSSGVSVDAGSPGENVIEGNYIGVNATGTAVLGNSANGIFLDAPRDTIGGLVPGARNIISGNALPGVFIGISAVATVVQGNYIGTDSSGNIDLGNIQNGVYIDRSANNIIGDSTAAGRNIISGNDFPGVYIFGLTAVGNRVLGNYIGLSASGTIGLGSGNGVIIDGAPFNIVGPRNVISGNPFPGIDLIDAGATGNRIVGNYVGTDADGFTAVANSKGILINNVPGNIIGGTTGGGLNLISGNTSYGIEIRGSGATGNKVMLNHIGTDVSGSNNIPNGSHGVVIGGSQDSVVFNTIAYNRGAGVYDSSGTGNLILGNSMHDNVGLGIDLAPQGLTINDSLDTDTGPNDHLNFPLLDSARVTNDTIIIHGRYNGKPNTQYTLDLYSSSAPHASHFGEGENYWSAGYTGVTDAGGNASFSVTFPFPSVDQFITATARDTAGNTSEFSQALCLSDNDEDGLPDSWETQGWGLDVNSDGIIDLDLYALGARPDHKDIFVEVDAMTGMAPQPGTLNPVVASFDSVPNTFLGNPDGGNGIHLHYLLDETNLPQYPWPTNWWQSFDSLKQRHFGTRLDSASPNARFILEAKRLVYRYCIFAYTHGTLTSSGIAENPGGLGGNDFMVTLGEGFSVPGGTEDDKAGTFMHELGHTLGLRHGGTDDILYKPNYISIMNYTWQFKFRWGTNFWALNYSPEALGPLDESSLDERVGLNPPLNTSYRIIEVPFSGPSRDTLYARLKPNTPVDWNGDGSIDSTTTVAGDLNIFDPSVQPSPGETLTSQTDWDKLVYNFRNSPAFTNTRRFGPLADTADDEMTGRTYQFLNNLPPPRPVGQFAMDGQLDTSATLLGTNAGIILYARYKAGQLYVAANTAQSQGADMFIFISDGANPLRPAPAGKSGQVAAWTVYLRNKSSDNSVGWYDSTDTPLTNITVDTVGGVLEGVIDIELLYGRDPANLYLAVGKYAPGTGGALLAQVPEGNGDGNIDSSELLQFVGTPPPPPYFTQDGGKLVGSGAVNTSVGVQQGSGVALSGDGGTAIIGGNADNNMVGAAWVFARNDNSWGQQGSKLVGSGAVGPARQGLSVSLSGDGNTALVGGFADNNSVGAVWVFTRSGNFWTQQGSKLVGSNVSGGFSYQGYACALSADGNTALVGGLADSGNVGAAWVFVRNGSVWTQQGNKLVGTGAVDVASPAEQGKSVALSVDGNTALIGGPNDSAGYGATWVFTRSNGVWSQQGSKLVGSGAVPSPGLAGQGWSVALSADGNTALVGSANDNDGIGAFWVFVRSGGVWSQQGGKLIGTGALNTPYGATQGYSVALSADGNTAAEGGIYDNNGIGALWIFTRTNGQWAQRGRKIIGIGTVGTTILQGYSVSLSYDGNTLIAGGPNDHANLGAAWVYIHEVPLPIQLASFTGHEVPGRGVQLDWTTLSEINNYGFNVQRRRASDSIFTELANAFIPGHGTTNIPHHYEFMDSAVPSGSWQYRLKQTDLDGTIHFSDPVPVSVLTGVGATAPLEYALLQNYPNPFNPATEVKFSVAKTGKVRIEVYNIIGQRVSVLFNDVAEAGHYHTVRFDGSNLASGVYFYRMQSGDFTAIKKLLLLK